MSVDYVKMLSEYKKTSKLRQPKDVETTESKIKKAEGSIKTKKERLSGAGLDSEVDTRNFIEKGLNLKEDQNFLFDIFEVLNRPQQAIFGGIENAQRGEDFWEGAKQGITGEKETRGKELLHNAGMDESGEFFGLDNVLGFALDVFADPVDLALIPVTGGASIAAGVVDTAGDVAKGAKATKNMKSISDLALSGAIKGTKGAIKLTDKSLEKALKLADQTKGIKYTNEGAKWARDLGKFSFKGDESMGMFEAYKTLKNELTTKFTSTVPKKIKDSVFKADSDLSKTYEELLQKRKVLKDNIDNYANKIKQSGESVEDVAKKVDQDIFDLKQFMDADSRQLSVKDLIKQGVDGKVRHTDNVESALKNIANDFSGTELDLDVSKVMFKDPDSGEEMFRLSLGSDWDKLIKGNLGDISFDRGTLDELVDVGNWYSKKDIDRLNSLKNKIETDSDFGKLWNEVSNFFDEGNKIIDDKFGTKLTEVYKNNEAYARNVVNPELLKHKQALTELDLYQDKYSLKGNSRILADRKYEMSALEANKVFKEHMRRNYDSLTGAAKELVDSNPALFNQLYTASFDDYLVDIPKLAKDSKLIDEVLLKTSFGDWNELKNVEKKLTDLNKITETSKNSGELTTLRKQAIEEYNKVLEGTTLRMVDEGMSAPQGFKLLDGVNKKKLVDKITILGKQTGLDDMENLKDFINKSDNIAIDPQVLNILGVTGNDNPKGLIRVYDKMLGFFKGNKTLSPTFQINNLLGNASNMYLSGMDPTTMMKRYSEAFSILNKKDALMQKVAKGVSLTPKEQKVIDMWDSFVEAGFGDAYKALDLYDMPEDLANMVRFSKKSKNPFTNLKLANNKMNQELDNLSRMAMFIEGINNKKFLDNLGVETAGDAVRRALFDPTDLTQFENDVMKRLIPFYTFGKKNLMYQIQNLGDNGRRYARLVEGYDSAMSNVLDDKEGNLPDFIKNNFYIPVPSVSKDGNYKVLRGTLPFGILVEMFDNPMQEVASMSSPLLKGMFEKSTNTNVFSGRPIENFEGEMSKNIPFMTKSMEHSLGNLTGLDVPLRVGSQLGTGFLENMTKDGGSASSSIMGGLQKALTLEQNIDKDKLYKLYDNIDQLETKIKQVEQKGVYVPTSKELRQRNNNPTINKINGVLNKYQ